ncbi:MAG: IS110 family transposase [Frankiales bacterium]|nr:IS110 family transposase [Frankiales bacterium]
MDVLFDRVAGLDIGKKIVVVCVRTPGERGRRRSEVRTFRTMTRHIDVLGDWLIEEGVQVAAMESTATYWKPVFYGLEDRLECWLLNAAHMKAVPGRKTDVRDAEWIAQLLEHGLVKPSFVPPPSIRRLRNLTRYRVQLMADRTRAADRLEKVLEDASIKLTSVASNITGASSREMLAALVSGERDASMMADLAHSTLRRKIPDLTEALTGRFDDHHALLVGAMLRQLDLADEALARLDAQIVAEMAPWQHQLDLLQTIPGIGKVVSQVIIAETGADMARFGSPEALSAWAGVAPAVHESAGKRTPAGSRQGNKWLTSSLVEASHSAARTKDTYLAAQYARLASRRGAKRAAVAVAHSMLVSAYWMLVRDEPYQDLGPDWLNKRNDQAHARRLVAQLERLGHTVVLDPVA